MTRRKSHLSYAKNTRSRKPKIPAEDNEQTGTAGKTPTAGPSEPPFKKLKDFKQETEDEGTRKMSQSLADLPVRLKNKIDNLITDLSSSGYESLLVVIRLTPSWTGHYGSAQGTRFLQQRAPQTAQQFTSFCADDAAHDAGDDLPDVADDGDLNQSHTDPDPTDDNEEWEETGAEGGKELCKVIKTEKLKVNDENRTQDGEIKDNKLVDCVDKQRDTVKESEKYAVGKTSNECKTSHKHNKTGAKVVIASESNTVSQGMSATKNYREAQVIKAENEEREMQPFPCQLCKKKFFSKEVMEKHIAVHKVKYTCGIDGCSAGFKLRKPLLQHQLLNHRNHMDKNRPFLCGMCGEAFLRNAHLKEHTERKHSHGKSLKCSICPKTFGNRLTLREHISRHKPSAVEYICELCGIVYKSRCGLYQHKCSQHMVGPPPKIEKHRCAVCGKEFMRKSSLDHHIISNNHMTSDQSMTSKSVYECDVCSKKFGVKQKYTRHVETVHKRTIVASCSFCGKGFSDRGNYTQHLRIHTGNRPNCVICKTIFRSQAALKRHMNEMHAYSQKTHSSDSYIQERGEKTALPEQTMSLESKQPFSLNDEHTVSIKIEPAVPAERNVTLVSEQATADQTVTKIGEQPSTETSGHNLLSVPYHVPQPMFLSPVTGIQTVKQQSPSSTDFLPGNNDTTDVTVTCTGDARNTPDLIFSQPEIFDQQWTSQ